MACLGCWNCGCIGHFEILPQTQDLVMRKLKPDVYMLLFAAAIIEGMSGLYA